MAENVFSFKIVTFIASFLFKSETMKPQKHSHPWLDDSNRASLLLHDRSAPRALALAVVVDAADGVAVHGPRRNCRRCAARRKNRDATARDCSCHVALAAVARVNRKNGEHAAADNHIESTVIGAGGIFSIRPDIDFHGIVC